MTDGLSNGQVYWPNSQSYKILCDHEWETRHEDSNVFPTSSVCRVCGDRIVHEIKVNAND